MSKSYRLDIIANMALDICREHFENNPNAQKYGRFTRQDFFPEMEIGFLNTNNTTTEQEGGGLYSTQTHETTRRPPSSLLYPEYDCFGDEYLYCKFESLGFSLIGEGDKDSFYESNY